MSLTARGRVEPSSYGIRPVNMNIAKVNNMEGCFSSRSESLGIAWEGWDGDGELVHSWWLAEADKRIAKFGCGLMKWRNGTQVVGDDGALLG